MSVILHEDTKLSKILARRARPHMELVRNPPKVSGWKGRITEETDTIWGLYQLPRQDPDAKEYAVVLFTDRFPDGLHFGPGERITIVRPS